MSPDPELLRAFQKGYAEGAADTRKLIRGVAGRMPGEGWYDVPAWALDEKCPRCEGHGIIDSCQAPCPVCRGDGLAVPADGADNRYPVKLESE